MYLHGDNMEMGCGLSVEVVRCRRYLYFWRYGYVSGRSQKTEKYMGPVGQQVTKEKALRALLEHQMIVKVAIERRISAYKRALTIMSTL